MARDCYYHGYGAMTNPATGRCWDCDNEKERGEHPDQTAPATNRQAAASK